MRVSIPCLCAFLLLVWCGGGSDNIVASGVRVVGPPSCDFTAPQIERMIDDVARALRQSNFTVTDGHFHVVNSTAFGANPGNPYVTYYPSDGIIRKNDPLFKLAPASAALFIGCTPKSPKYFSWRSYAFTSRGKLVFASLGDSLNNLVIRTSSSSLQPSGSLTAVATTADRGTLSAISAAMGQAGVPESILNVDAVPSNLLDMESDPTLSFLMLHRASVWGDQGEKEAYFAQNRRVLFIHPPKSGAAPLDPLPQVPLRPPGSGSPEELLPGLQDNLRKLTESIVASMSGGYTFVSATNLTALKLDGFECLKDGSDCLGDNRDTHYLSHKDAAFDDTDVYVFVGSQSVVTGKCVYTNFGLYQVEHTPILNRTKAISTNLTVDYREMTGSAGVYGVDDTRLVAYKLSRHCDSARYCLKVGYSDREVPAATEWAVAYRPYLDPKTKTGPKLSELVTPMIMKFKKKTTSAKT